MGKHSCHWAVGLLLVVSHCLPGRWKGVEGGVYLWQCCSGEHATIEVLIV